MSSSNDSQKGPKGNCGAHHPAVHTFTNTIIASEVTKTPLLHFSSSACCLHAMPSLTISQHTLPLFYSDYYYSIPNRRHLNHKKQTPPPRPNAPLLNKTKLESKGEEQKKKKVLRNENLKRY